MRQHIPGETDVQLLQRRNNIKIENQVNFIGYFSKLWTIRKESKNNSILSQEVISITEQLNSYLNAEFPDLKSPETGSIKKGIQFFIINLFAYENIPALNDIIEAFNWCFAYIKCESQPDAAIVREALKKYLYSGKLLSEDNDTLRKYDINILSSTNIEYSHLITYFFHYADLKNMLNKINSELAEKEKIVDDFDRLQKSLAQPEASVPDTTIQLIKQFSTEKLLLEKKDIVSQLFPTSFKVRPKNQKPLPDSRRVSWGPGFHSTVSISSYPPYPSCVENYFGTGAPTTPPPLPPLPASPLVRHSSVSLPLPPLPKSSPGLSRQHQGNKIEEIKKKLNLETKLTKTPSAPIAPQPMPSPILTHLTQHRPSVTNQRHKKPTAKPFNPEPTPKLNTR